MQTQTTVEPTQVELDALNEKLAAASPQALLQWAVQEFGAEVALACSFGGITGMVLLDMAVKTTPAMPVFSLDTNFLFPETYALRDEVSRKYNLNLQIFAPKLSPAEQAAVYGDRLWETDPDKCCALRKVEPNRRALSGLRAWITGLRRDQAETRRQVQPVAWDAKFGLYKISPLWDWTEEMVWTYIQAEEVPYNALHDQGYPSLGCTHCTRPVLPGEDSRAGRWSGFAKTECGLHK